MINVSHWELPDEGCHTAADWPEDLRRLEHDARRLLLVEWLQGLEALLSGREGELRLAGARELVDELLALTRAILEAPQAPRAELQRRYVGRVLNRVVAALSVGDGVAGHVTLVGGKALAQRAAALRDRVMAAELKPATLRLVD